MKPQKRLYVALIGGSVVVVVAPFCSFMFVLVVFLFKLKYISCMFGYYSIRFLTQGMPSMCLVLCGKHNVQVMI